MISVVRDLPRRQHIHRSIHPLLRTNLIGRVVPRVDDVPPYDEVVKDGHQGGQCIKYQRDTIHEGLP
ncbi:hypothetical protein V1477_008345 [Vespula maculifrons]|uniref:Uncharacterized protein n=2 Tax=Vespula TaxID=7451 RepID=A0A834JMF7_VESVU|nr:hypothetical protein HZH66_009327 [Vespula vulgaris]